MFLFLLAHCSRFAAHVCMLHLSSLVAPCSPSCHSGAKWTWASRAAAAGRENTVQGIIYIAFLGPCKMQCSGLRPTVPGVCFSIFGFSVLSEYIMQWALGFKCYFKTLLLQRLGNSKA